MKISFIIVNYNGKECLKECLDSILKLDFLKEKYEVIVIDNNSRDKSWEIVKEYKKARLIKLKENVGFAEGNNIGIKMARGEYIVLFNNDLIVDRKWVKETLPIIEKNKKIGAIGGKIYIRKTNKVWYGGARIYFGGFANQKWLGNKEGECDYMAGAAMMIRKKALNKVGLFEKNFFMYAEDTDLCFRMQRKGYKIMYCPKAVSYHMIKEGRASSSQEYYEQRNRVYLYAKNYKKIKYLFLFLDFFVYFPLFWFNRVWKNPRKLKFWRESLRARIDSIKMSLKSRSP